MVGSAGAGITLVSAGKVNGDQAGTRGPSVGRWGGALPL